MPSKKNLEIIFNRYNFASKYIQNKDVLEIGCGSGVGSNIIIKKSKSYLGIDSNNENIIESQKNNPNMSKSFLNCNAYDLESLNLKFDVVLCLATIYYLDINKFLTILKNVIKQNGILIFDMSNYNIPNFDSKWDGQTNYYQIGELRKIFRNNNIKSFCVYGSIPIKNNFLNNFYLNLRKNFKNLLIYFGLNKLKKLLIFLVDRKFYKTPKNIQELNNYKKYGYEKLDNYTNDNKFSIHFYKVKF